MIYIIIDQLKKISLIKYSKHINLPNFYLIYLKIKSQLMLNIKFRHDSILEGDRSDQEPIKKLYFLKESNIKSQLIS